MKNRLRHAAGIKAARLPRLRPESAGTKCAITEHQLPARHTRFHTHAFMTARGHRHAPPPKEACYAGLQSTPVMFAFFATHGGDA